ncbi:hypothetical protein S40288_10777 [Stachybotrys chartarum IBT 40288]|nr:hypothetical protein S40288_10777 [Stachybotrys chartarum IBT 40288]
MSVLRLAPGSCIGCLRPMRFYFFDINLPTVTPSDDLSDHKPWCPRREMPKDEKRGIEKDLETSSPKEECHGFETTRHGDRQVETMGNPLGIPRPLNAPILPENSSLPEDSSSTMDESSTTMDETSTSDSDEDMDDDGSSGSDDSVSLGSERSDSAFADFPCTCEQKKKIIAILAKLFKAFHKFDKSLKDQGLYEACSSEGTAANLGVMLSRFGYKAAEHGLSVGYFHPDSFDMFESLVQTFGSYEDTDLESESDDDTATLENIEQEIRGISEDSSEFLLKGPCQGGE